MIHGVEIIPLRQILDERGKVMHMLRRDAPHFREFGEIYFATVEPGAVKGWHLHTKMTLNYAVPIGKIKLVMYDDRADSPTKGEIQEVFMGPENYNLVIIPPFVWNGTKGIASHTSYIANCATLPHDADEIKRCDPHDGTIPYNWARKDG